MSSKPQEKTQDKGSSSASASGSGSGSNSSAAGSAAGSAVNGPNNFARDNGGIVGGMTDAKGEQFTSTASMSVAPATAAQIAQWNAAWPNTAPLLKDFDTSVKYFQTLTRRDLSGPKKTVHTVGWNCTGNRLAAGSVDQTARVWVVDHRGVGSSSTELELKGHTDRVDQIAWSPTNADLLATASTDKTVRVWDCRMNGSGKCVQNIATKGQNISLTWSPDASYIAVGNNKDVVSVIDCKTWRIIKEQKFQSEVNEMTWNKTGEYFLVTTGLGTVDILRFPSFEHAHSVDAHTGHCYCVEFDTDGKYMATGGADAFVTLWSLSEFACIRTFDRSESPIRGISFSHNGQFLATASEDFRIEIMDVESGEHVHTVKTRAESNSVAWNPRHLLLAYAIDDKTAGAVSVFGWPGDGSSSSSSSASSSSASSSSGSASASAPQVPSSSSR